MFRLCKTDHRRWLPTLAVALVTLGSLLASAGTALAMSAPIQISGTDGEGVLIQSEPNAGSTRLGLIPEGASPEYNCFTHGEMVGNVSVWFNVTYDGITGDYASYYDNSSYTDDAELTAKYGVSACEATQPASPTQTPATGSGNESSSSPSIAPSGISFNRGAAVAWAEAHATQTPPDAAACTWFVSQALWAGGLPQTAAWTSSGHHGSIPVFTWRPGTVDAWAVSNFVNYIRAAYPASTYTELSFHVNNVPLAEPGDVIVYAWKGVGSVNNTSGLEHAALVVGDAPGTQYPEVAEWGADDDGVLGRPVNYKKRGWTWSEIHHEWLQSEPGYKHVKAFLLHIDTRQ
jgi:hypothetical protein